MSGAVSTPRRWLRYAVAAGAAYWMYRLVQAMLSDDGTEDTETAGLEQERHTEAALGERHRRKRPSFSLTDENGTTTGALSDEAAQGWGWIVDSKKSSSKPALKATPPEAVVGRGSERTGRSSKGVEFRLDTRSNFYGFVYRYDGVCVAHGADSAFVGLHLKDVLRKTNNTDVDGEELHQRFLAAAEAGGGFVSYRWRHSAHTAVKVKGAFIIKVKPHFGQSLYAGVGYRSCRPRPTSRRAACMGSCAQTAAKSSLTAHRSRLWAAPLPR